MEEEDKDIAAAALLTKGAISVALIHSILNGADCQERKARLSRNRWAKLNEEEKRRHAKKVPRPSTVLQQRSPWNTLYFRGDQQAFITVTGLDPQCFHELLTVFEPLFDSNLPYSRNKDGYIRRIN